MIRSSFEMKGNPNAENGCSCGTSFAPKWPKWYKMNAIKNIKT